MTQTVAQRGGIIENLEERYAAAVALMAAEGIYIKHYRPTIYLDNGDVIRAQNGGLTVAYRRLKGNSFVEIATAICSARDMYNRKVGTTLSVEAFASAQRIRVPDFGATPGAVVNRLFAEYVCFEDEA